MIRFYRQAFLIGLSFFLLVNSANVFVAQAQDSNSSLSPLEILQQKTKKRVYIKTKTVKPLALSIYPFAGNYPRKISGEVSFNGTLQEAEKVVFYLETKYKEKLWQKELLWRERFVRGNSVRIPFVFDLPERNIQTDLRLRVVAVGSYEKVLAEGQTMVYLPNIKQDALFFSAINDLRLIKEKNTINGRFQFENNSLKAPLKAQVTIKPESLSQTEAETYWVPVDSMDIGTSRTIEFEFPLPTKPQLYTVGVQMFTAEDMIPLSGVLEEKLLIEGIFAEVIDFDYTPKNYWTADTPVMFDFRGEVSDPLLKNIDVRLTVWSHNREAEAGADLQTQIYTETQPMTINQYRQFAGHSELLAPWGMEQLKGQIDFVSQNKTIGTFPFVTPVYPAPPKSISDRIISTIVAPLANQKQLSTPQKFLIMLGALGVIIALGFGIYRFTKRHKPRHLILLIVSLCLPFHVLADSVHFTHFTDEIYTSQGVPSSNMSLGDEYFRIIPIRGTAEDISGGKFIPDEATEVFMFFLPIEASTPMDGEFVADDIALAAVPGAVVVANVGANAAVSSFIPENPSDYFYEVNAHVAGFAEGSYKLVRMEYDSPNMTCPPATRCRIALDMEVGYEYVFEIDKTAPNVVFEVRTPSTATILKDPAGYVDPTPNPTDESYPAFSDLSDTEKSTRVGEYFVNGPVEVTVNCDGDCPEDGNTFEVLGNFCSQPAICDAIGVRSFTFCDGIMNCGSPVELELKHFDGTPPSFTNFKLALQDSPSVNRLGDDPTPLKVDDAYTFSILNSADGTSIDSAAVDSHACGGGTNDVTSDDFFNNNTTCQQKEFRCAMSSSKRGTMSVVNTEGEIISEVDRVCNASCDQVSHELTDAHTEALVSYYCGASDPHHPNNGGDGQKNCCVPACKFSFPYCFPLPFY